MTEACPAKERLFFPSSDGSTRLEAFLCHPGGPPVGILLILHGMQEHFGRYQPLIGRLAAAGYRIGGYNQLGHGGSLFEGHPGVLPPQTGPRRLAADCRRFLWAIRQRYPALPCFVLGHSFGSFVLRAALSDPAFSRELSGVILSATAGASPALSLLALPAARGLCALRGEGCQSALFDRAANGLLARPFPQGRSRHRWVSSIGREVEEFDGDPLMQFIPSAGLYRAMLETLALVSKPGWAKTIDRRLPVLLVSGRDDPVGGAGRGVRQVARRLSRAGLQDVSLYLAPGSRHEVLRDRGREALIERLLIWMEKRRPPF